jgi:hypothetical protein
MINAIGNVEPSTLPSNSSRISNGHQQQCRILHSDIVTTPLTSGYELNILTFQGRCVLCPSENISFLNSGKSYVAENDFQDSKYVNTHTHTHTLLLAFLFIPEDSQEITLLPSEFPYSGFRVIPLALLADARIIIIIIITGKTVIF